MQLRVQIQGHSLLFLVDSGSSSCFLDQSKAELFTGKQQLKCKVQVQVDGGEILSSTDFFPELQWTSHGHQFVDVFRILPLNSYDGIIGHDWLAKHSAMLTHWSDHWIAFEQEGQLVVLHGEEAPLITHAMIELHVVEISDKEPEQQHTS